MSRVVPTNETGEPLSADLTSHFRRATTYKDEPEPKDDKEIRSNIQGLIEANQALPLSAEDRTSAFNLLSFKKEAKVVERELPGGLTQTFNDPNSPDLLGAEDEQYLPGILHLNAKLPLFVIHPESLGLFLWNILICAGLFYMATIMPVVLSFYDTEAIGFQYIDAMLDILFVADLGVNFLVAYYDKDELVSGHRMIVCKYLKSWFILDLMASVPFSFMELFDTSSGSQGTSLLKLAKLPRFYRLVKFVRFFKVMKALRYRKLLTALLERLNVSLATLRSLKFLIILLFLLHLTSCAWYYVDYVEDFPPDCWIQRGHLMDLSVGDYYLWSLYWALTVLDTIGYGDIVPKLPAEIILCMIWMAVGISFYSYTISNLSVMFYNINKRQNYIQQKEDFLREFGQNVSMPKALLKQVKYYVRYNYNHNVFSWSEMHQFLKELPSKLYTQVYRHIFKDVLENITFFKNKPPEFISDIMPLMKTVVVHEGYELYSYGSTPKDVFFLLKGRVMVKDKMNAVLFSYVKGSYFGEVEVIKKVDRKTSTQIEETAHLLKIESDDFLDIMEKYPDIKQEILTIAENRVTALQEKKAKFKEARRKLGKLQLKSKEKDLTQLNPLLNNILSMNVDDEEYARVPAINSPVAVEPEPKPDPDFVIPENNRFLKAFTRNRVKKTITKPPVSQSKPFSDTQIEFLLEEINGKHHEIENFSVRIGDICREQEEMYGKLTELYEKLERKQGGFSLDSLEK